MLVNPEVGFLLHRQGRLPSEIDSTFFHCASSFSAFPQSFQPSIQITLSLRSVSSGSQANLVALTTSALILRTACLLSFVFRLSFSRRADFHCHADFDIFVAKQFVIDTNDEPNLRSTQVYVAPVKIKRPERDSKLVLKSIVIVR